MIIYEAFMVFSSIPYISVYYKHSNNMLKGQVLSCHFCDFM